VTEGGWLRPAHGGARRYHGRRGARRIAAAIAAAALVLLPLAPSVAAADGLDLTTSYPAVAVAPGAHVSFDVDVTSTTTTRVGLSLSGTPAGWTATINGGGNVIDAVLVAAGKATQVRVDVTVPADATGSHRITVDANDGGRTASLPLDIRVSAEAAGDVSLTTNAPSLTGASNETFTFSVTFHNDTPEDLVVSAAATGPAGWTLDTSLTAASQAASVEVKAGSTTTISIKADPPDDVAAGTYPISLQATAGSKSASGELAVVITGSYGMSLTTSDAVLSAHGSAGSAITKTLVVENTGTAPLENVSFSGTPPSDWTVTFDPESLASVAPGEKTSVTATITPSGDAIAGDYAVTIRSSSANANDSIDLRVTVETSLLWGVVGLAVIVLVFVGLGWVFRRYGRR
jgi:uncharacterized repeat protein (TIGR01451 family)